MDFFQSESKRLRALATAEPTAENVREARRALQNKFQGFQHLGAQALCAWIERARKARKPVRAGRKVKPGPEQEWIELLCHWAVLLPRDRGWRQSESHAARLFARFVRAEDFEWLLDMYFAMGSRFRIALAQLPADVCVPRLEELALSSANPTERHLAESALRCFEFEGKEQFHAERRANDPNPREWRVRSTPTHDPRRHLGRRRRWS